MKIDFELFRSQLKTLKYSEKSIASFCSSLKQFMLGFQTYDADTINVPFIGQHLNWLVQEKAISTSYQRQILTAVQKYYDLVLGLKLDLSVIYPKDHTVNLPNCLCQADIKLMIERTVNLKHKATICLLYSAGLRLSELLNLTLTDIDLAKREIHIVNPKDKSIRIVMLSPTLLEKLHEYFKKYNPRHFVIEWLDGKAFSEKSVQLIVKQAAERVGITSPVTPQCLRHSFAAHLLEKRIDIHYVQELLGHSSIKTTENYIHKANITKGNLISPLDLL